MAVGAMDERIYAVQGIVHWLLSSHSTEAGNQWIWPGPLLACDRDHSLDQRS